MGNGLTCNGADVTGRGETVSYVTASGVTVPTLQDEEKRREPLLLFHSICAGTDPSVLVLYRTMTQLLKEGEGVSAVENLLEGKERCRRYVRYVRYVSFLERTPTQRFPPNRNCSSSYPPSGA